LFFHQFFIIFYFEKYFEASIKIEQIKKIPFAVVLGIFYSLLTIISWIRFFNQIPQLFLGIGKSIDNLNTVLNFFLIVYRKGCGFCDFLGFWFLKLHKTPVLEIVYLLIYSPAVITGILEFLKSFLFRVIIISDSLYMATKRINFPFGVGANCIRPPMIQINFPIYGKINFSAYTKVVFAN
jgi:hypothetical protein